MKSHPIGSIVLVPSTSMYCIQNLTIEAKIIPHTNVVSNEATRNDIMDFVSLLLYINPPK